MTPLPSFPPRGLPRDLAAFYVGLAVDQFDRMVQDGRMPTPRIVEGQSVWDRREIDAAFDHLPRKDAAKEAEPPKATSHEDALKRQVYTPKTLAAFWSCSESLVRGLIARDEIRSFSLGGKLLRIRADDVADYTAKRLQAHAIEVTGSISKEE